MMRKTDRTVAKIGRSTKKCDRFMPVPWTVANCPSPPPLGAGECPRLSGWRIFDPPGAERVGVRWGDPHAPNYGADPPHPPRPHGSSPWAEGPPRDGSPPSPPNGRRGPGSGALGERHQIRTTQR